jgi:hypothetical protein
MPARIIFNGQEYASVEAMPENVRNAYLTVLTMLRDTDSDGIPDVFENGSRSLGNVGGLPEWTRRLAESAVRQGLASSEPGAQASGDLPEPLDTAQSTMGVMLAFMAGFVLVFSVGLIFALGGGRERLAGRLTIAIAALLFLGWLDTHATRLAQRRRPLLAPDTTGYRRFVVWSSSGLLLATVLLLGLALFLR